VKNFEDKKVNVEEDKPVKSKAKAKRKKRKKKKKDSAFEQRFNMIQ
jgi:hypothetical protein